MPVTMLLAYALLLGLAACGLATVVRAVVPQMWLLVKPFSCDLCMSWWSAWAVALAMNYSEPVSFLRTLVLVLAATGVSVLGLKASNRLGD